MSNLSIVKKNPLDGKATKIEVTVPHQMLFDLLCAAFEGGSSDWLHQADYIGPKTPDPTRKLVWWGHEELFDESYKITVKYDDPEREEGDSATKIIGWDQIIEGAMTMAMKYPDLYGEAHSDGNWDANTADVFMQCVVMGDCIYG